MIGFGFWFALLAVTVILMVAMLFALEWAAEKYFPAWEAGHKNWAVRAGYSALFVCVVAALSPLYLEFPSWPSKLYVVENGELRERPWGTFGFWEQVVWVPGPGERVTRLGGEVSSITSNPKVRTISYQVSGWVADAEKYLLDNPNRWRAWISGGDDSVQGDVEELIDYWIYELNNAHSAELAMFYNPRDQDQQREFRMLVETWLTEGLSPIGIRVEVSDFSLR